jgi:integrase
VKRHVRFHDLRHTCASHLVSGSWGRAWTLEEVAKHLGHSSSAVTRRYAHLCPEGLARAVRETRPELQMKLLRIPRDEDTRIASMRTVAKRVRSVAT